MREKRLMQCTWHVWPFLLRREKKAEAMALKNCLGAASLTEGQRLCYGGTTCAQCPGHNIGAPIPNLCLHTHYYQQSGLAGQVNDASTQTASSASAASVLIE